MAHIDLSKITEPLQPGDTTTLPNGRVIIAINLDRSTCWGHGVDCALLDDQDSPDVGCTQIRCGHLSYFPYRDEYLVARVRGDDK